MDTNEQVVINTTENKPKNKFSKRKKIIIGIVAFLFLSGIGGYVFTLAPTKEARIFTQDLLNSDFQKAYDSSYSGFQESNTIEQFTGALKGFSDFGPDAEISFTSRTIENNIAEISGTLKEKNGGKSYIFVQLIKTDNGWKVSGIKGGDLTK